MTTVELRKEPMSIEVPNSLDIVASSVVVGKLIKRSAESDIGHAYDVVLNQRVEITAVADIIGKYIARSTGRHMSIFLFDPNNGMFEVYLHSKEPQIRKINNA